MSLPEAFLRSVRERLPSDLLTTDPSELAEYGRDWTRVFTPAPSAIAFPRSTEELATLVSLCRAHQVAIVPSGGRTGLAGGAVAMKGELVVSLKKMNRIGEVDLLGNTVFAQAGAITEAVHQHCAPHGLTWPVDFASKGSSTVGGNIATNAGGVKVIRYGLTRQWVLGLEVVTAQGEVLTLNGALEKNNTGLDLRQLFIGSEGTLGIITGATLKLTALPGRQDVMLFAVPDISAVVRLFRAWRQSGFELAAYEFFTDKCLARLMRHRQVRPPFESPSACYVLVETERAEPEALENFLGKLFEQGLVTDGTLAQNAAQGRELWTLREGISESLSATGLPHKNDVALPIASLEGFCADLSSVFAARYPTFEIALFGHIGDGNLHINIMKPDEMEKAEFLAHTHEADPTMFELVKRHGGSISAEHGIGLLKKEFLSFSRTPQELAAQKAVKRALDPENLLNPGKIFDL